MLNNLVMGTKHPDKSLLLWYYPIFFSDLWCTQRPFWASSAPDFARRQSGTHLREVHVTKSFKAVLTAYRSTPHPYDGSLPRLSSADVAHLKRWADDERADEVWNAIESAAKEHGKLVLPARFFIQEVLGARDIAKSINHRRNNRERYLKHAARIVEVAKVLRAPLPNGLLLIPTGRELAERLDEATRAYRDYVAVARNEARGMKWTRQSKPVHVFMKLLSNDLKGMTGKFLDHEVAVLTEIAFDEIEIDDDEVIWARRRAKRNTKARKRSK
jgi:hypothetical protein